ncbi:TPA_asm: hypothetical protein [Altiarchaeum virus]|nr:MAG: hypothetical protein BWK75_06355 [Candidatus Altiarchaeales archaeon A3]DAZ85568.1 TPA_asm: hypothetical protein [Altiarchaeum virus]
MPKVVKSVNLTETHPEDIVIYTYIFTNDFPDVAVILTKIEDNIFGIIWEGLLIVYAGNSKIVTYTRTADCNTIRNKARAFYVHEEEHSITPWSNEVLVKCSYPFSNTEANFKELQSKYMGNMQHRQDKTINNAEYLSIIKGFNTQQKNE